MGRKERETIKEYLIEELRSQGTFSSISPNSAFHYSTPEEKRCISLERGTEKYLVVVHSDTSYKPEQKALIQLMQFLRKEQGVACVSVFDDSVFYNWDEGPLKPSRTGTSDEIRKRIKLLGLERQAQELGPVTYYKQQSPKLEVVRFTGGVVADYSRSDRTPVWIKERELLTVMDAEVLETFTQFDVAYDKEVKGVAVAKFVVPRIFDQEEEEDYDEEVEYDLDERLQFAMHELDSGNEEPLDLLTGDDITRLRQRRIF